MRNNQPKKSRAKETTLRYTLNSSKKFMMQLFLVQKVSGGSIYKQTSYMQRHLKKEIYLEIKIISRRLKEMSCNSTVIRGIYSKSSGDHELM